MKSKITTILQKKTELLLNETKTDGTLNFYHDKLRCGETELVRIWKYQEEIVEINNALKCEADGTA